MTTPTPNRAWTVLLSCTALVPLIALALPAHAQQTVQLDDIEVTGTADDDANSVVASGATSGGKIATPILDTAASVSVVTAREIELRGAQNTEQVLAYSAGVTVNEWGGDDRYDAFRIRGFDQLSMGTYRDGLPVRGFGWTFARREPYGFERVEVLKGSNSALFGLNAPGGLVNAVTKTPTGERFGEAYTSLGADHAEVGLDFGDRLNADGSLSYRITAKRQDSAYTYDHSNDDRSYLAAALSYRPTEATELVLMLDYNQRKGVPGVGFPTGADVDIDTFLGEPDFNRFDTTERSIGYSASHDFGNGLTIRQTARATTMDLDYEQVYGATTDPSANRSSFAVYSESEQAAIDTQIQYDAEFGGVKSRTLAGLEFSRITVDETALFGTAGPIDITEPSYCGRACVALNPYIDWVPEQETRSIYLQQELTIADRWIVTLGGRQDDVDIRINRPGTAGDQSSRYDTFSRRAGLTYKITPGLAVYGNYSESFEPNVWNLSLDPTAGKQYELGLKFQPEGSNALFTAAIFDLTQTNVNSQVSPAVYRQIGKIGVRGLELEGKWQVNDRLNLIAAYSHWDAEIREDGIGGNQGNRPSRVPQDLASVWADYTLQDGKGRDVTLGIGARYVGDTFGDDANTVSVDAYTVLDASMSYELTKDVALAVNAANLLDTEYRTTSYFGSDYYGEGRTVHATVKYKW